MGGRELHAREVLGSVDWFERALVPIIARLRKVGREETYLLSAVDESVVLSWWQAIRDAVEWLGWVRSADETGGCASAMTLVLHRLSAAAWLEVRRRERGRPGEVLIGYSATFDVTNLWVAWGCFRNEVMSLLGVIEAMEGGGG